jgi:hypothetical protein
MSIRLQEQLSLLLFGAACIWGVHATMTQFSAGNGITYPQLQLEVAGIGFLIWLHAKWRRSISAK